MWNASEHTANAQPYATVLFHTRAVKPRVSEVRAASPGSAFSEKGLADSKVKARLALYHWLMPCALVVTIDEAMVCCLYCCYLDALEGACHGATDSRVAHAQHTSSGVVIGCWIGWGAAHTLAAEFLLCHGDEHGVGHKGCGAMALADGSQPGAQRVKDRAAVGAWADKRDRGRWGEVCMCVS